MRFASNENPIKIIWTQKIEPLFPIDMAVSPEDVFVALGCTNGAIRVLNLKKGINFDKLQDQLVMNIDTIKEVF